jgi:hypothetical protein
VNSHQISCQKQRKVNLMKNTVFMFKDSSTLSPRCHLADISKFYQTRHQSSRPEMEDNIRYGGSTKSLDASNLRLTADIALSK